MSLDEEQVLKFMDLQHKLNVEYNNSLTHLEDLVVSLQKSIIILTDRVIELEQAEEHRRTLALEQPE